MILRVLLLAGLTMASRSAGASFRATALPPSDFADTEVSTNICLDVTHVLEIGDNFRFFDVTLELAATPTNNVEIIFGVDLNQDGGLDKTERDFVLGWDSGSWFWRDRRANLEPRFGGVGSFVDRRTLNWRIVLDKDHLPLHFMAKEGQSICEGAATASMFSSSWNMARVVARGGGEPDERISVKMNRNAMRVIIR